MRHLDKVCVIVDGFSTANALAPVIAGYGLPSVHIQSSVVLPDFLTRTHMKQWYVDEFVYTGNIDAVVAWLKQLGRTPVCVVAGAETGVWLGDQLAKALGLPGNDPATTPVRRDKEQMATAAAAAGVRTIPHLTSSSVDEAWEWARVNGFGSDLVSKPKSSSGSFGFRRSRSKPELADAFASWIGEGDVFGEPIGSLLVQPFVHGDEYAINTVSGGGRYVVTDIWRTKKRRENASVLYDVELLLDPADRMSAILHEFVGSVLGALGIREGAAHTEVIVTPEGPTLVETGARFMGSIDISQLTSALGVNAVQLMAEALVVPEKFHRRATEGWRPHLLRNAAMVQMLSRHSGSFGGYNIDRLRELASFHAVDTYLEIGDRLDVTVNSYSTPGLIFLAASDQETILADYQLLRELEEHGALFYRR